MIDPIEVSPEDRILHLGCGDGEVTGRLARLASRGLAVGLDPSEETIRRGRRLWAAIENLMLARGDPGDPIPWQEGFFSAVLCQGEWPPGEIFRVLETGGRLVSLDPGTDSGNRLVAAGFEQVRLDGLRLEARKP